jgi:hypothetical protein
VRWSGADTAPAKQRLDLLPRIRSVHTILAHLRPRHTALQLRPDAAQPSFIGILAALQQLRAQGRDPPGRLPVALLVGVQRGLEERRRLERERC